MSAAFRVWAPRAEQVEVVLAGGRRTAMASAGERHGRGWVAVEVDDAGEGTDYGFSLDGGPVRADPRSAWQPAGPEGLSRVVDHDSFRWSDRSWRGFSLPSAVLYELHVGTFSPDGTFAGVAGRIDHLIDLGVTALELMPVAEFAGERGWGYDGVNLFAPHHRYGGPDGLKRLVDACHARGLGVIVDVVYNHLGPSGNYLGEFGPYFTDRYRIPWGQAVNFDGPGSDEVRRFVVDNAVHWLVDYHCDGLRLDAVHAIFDASATHILEQLASEVAAVSAASGWRRWLIAESDLNDPRLVRDRGSGGYGLDAQWADDFHHSLHALVTGERDGCYRDFGSLDDLGTAVRSAYVYAGRYSPYRDRSHGRPADGVPGSSFVGYAQNHDHVGNRAEGDRLAARLSPGRLEAVAAVVLTAPFVPMLFQGEEWAASTPFAYFTDHGDPSLREAVRAGRRAEFASFGWDPDQVPDPQDPATFGRSRLDWSEAAGSPHREMLAWYRRLIQLRRDYPELADGRRERVRFRPYPPGAFSLSRGRVTVAANLGAAAISLPAGPSTPAGAPCRLLLASEPACTLDGGVLLLPPDSVAVVETTAAGPPAGGIEPAGEPPARPAGEAGRR